MRSVLFMGRSTSANIYLGAKAGRTEIWVPHRPGALDRWVRISLLPSTRRRHAAEHMVIHALENGDMPENLTRYKAPCAACGTTTGLAIIAGTVAFLLLLPDHRMLNLTGALMLAPVIVMLANADRLWRRGLCEQVPRWNLLARASVWIQSRFLLLPPTLEDLELAARRGRELLEKLSEKGITIPTSPSGR